MAREIENRDHERSPGPSASDRILDDDQRRSSEFLRDFFAHHRVDSPDTGNVDESS